MLLRPHNPSAYSAAHKASKPGCFALLLYNFKKGCLIKAAFFIGRDFYILGALTAR